MRKSKQEAAETRQRIVKTAAREFKRNGIVASGLADLMKAAGLTHGGFYKHFASKDALVAEAAEVALAEKDAWYGAKDDQQKIAAGLEAAVSNYLSNDHREHPEQGCFLAALGSELPHCDSTTRDAITRGLNRYIDTIARHFPDLPPDEARQRATAITTSMIGAIIMSRAVSDQSFSDSILTSAKALILAKAER